MEIKDGNPFPVVPDTEHIHPNAEKDDKFLSTFAVESTELQRLICELDKTAPSELIADEDFETRLCELVSKQLHNYSLPLRQHELITCMSEANHHVTEDTVRALFALRTLQERGVSLFGCEVGYTEMLMGICQHRLRADDKAIKSLRNALTYFQQFGDDTAYGIMIENLCRMSEIYRLADKKDSARSCMQQAFRLLSFGKGDWTSHCRLLTEMAHVMEATCNYEVAIKAYKRLVKEKSDVGRTSERSTIDILIRLSNVYCTVNQLEEARHSLICAGVFYHQLCDKDEHQFVEILQRLSGVLFQQWQFKQADVLTERANQIIGRAGSAPTYVLLGDLMNRAAHQRELGNDDESKRLYRIALAGLEPQREMRIIDRLPILAGILLLTPPQHGLQRASLLADMEVSLNQFFCERDLPVLKGIMRVGWIYNFLGYNSAANDLMMVAEQLARPQILIQDCDKIAENTRIRLITERPMHESTSASWLPDCISTNYTTR